MEGKGSREQGAGSREQEAFGNNLAGRQLDARVNQFLIFTISFKGMSRGVAGGGVARKRGEFVGVLCVCVFYVAKLYKFVK